MHFLLGANPPRSLVAVVEGAGFACTHVRDTGLAAATDASIATPVLTPDAWKWVGGYDRASGG